MNQRQLAEAFSNGNFERTYPHLSETISWNVVGENYFDGKNAVIENCEQTAAYFKSVQTDFQTLHTIEEGNKVVVNGTAAFFKEGKQVAYVLACDLYEFNESGKLQTITSYCIQQK